MPALVCRVQNRAAEASTSSPSASSDSDTGQSSGVQDSVTEIPTAMAEQSGVPAGGLLYVIKAVSLATLATLVAVYGLEEHTLRRVVYVGLHGSYLLWWYLHGVTQPHWYSVVFNKMKIPTAYVPAFLGVLGAGYVALPGLMAFTNPEPMSPYLALASIALFSLGMGLNVSADTFKSATKLAGVNKPTKEVWDGRATFNLPGITVMPNHLGDWMRYSSFALCSGRAPSWIIPALVVLTNWSTLRQRSLEASNGKTHGKTNGRADVKAH